MAHCETYEIILRNKVPFWGNLLSCKNSGSKKKIFNDFLTLFFLLFFDFKHVVKMHELSRNDHGSLDFLAIFKNNTSLVEIDDNVWKFSAQDFRWNIRWLANVLPLNKKSH